MATITPANLAYKDKDGDLGEVKSLTDTDVTLLNNALQDIEDLKLAYMPGYVKRDFSNVTQDGKNAAVGWLEPDYSRAIDITSSVTTTNTSITIDNDSIIRVQMEGPSSGSYIIQVYLDDVLIIAGVPHNTYPSIYYSLLIKAGTHTIRATTSAGTIAYTLIPLMGA